MITGREFLAYLLGSYLVAAVLSVGAGLIFDTTWRAILGSTLIMGLFIFSVTLVDAKKKRDAQE